MPDVRHRDGKKFREGALAIHSDALGIRAKMPATSETIATMTTHDVAFAGDQVPWSEPFYSLADTFDHANVLMADDHRDRDRLLRPGIPVIDVNIGAADGRL